MSFRIEEKFPCTKFEQKKILVELQKIGLKTLHPKREIRSIYFDNNHKRMFEESQEGSVPRKKIRIREYPLHDKTISLETKISSVEGKYKNSIVIQDDQKLKFLKFGRVDSLYGLCFPIIEVSYLRHYFFLDKIRITIDEDIIYKIYNSKITKRDPVNVIEVKAPADVSEGYLKKLIPISRRRFSKYSRGCELLSIS
ncbi:VTC domain-containing protein [Gammaproteobacteria bacterium]|nr:VTC domain-containing protein [Gammaproteobacteria bacterium]